MTSTAAPKPSDIPNHPRTPRPEHFLTSEGTPLTQTIGEQISTRADHNHQEAQ